MIREILETWCKENDISLTDGQKEAFEIYFRLLTEWNQKMNLTAITEEQEVAVKHFIDSISVLKCIDLKVGASLIDIGTGAGFPGIPLKIMRPDLKLTLLDSLNKRLIFLSELCKTLLIEAELLHARAEEYGAKPEYREQYDYSVSRAVANLPSLCEYCIPYIKVGGSFIAMKGPDGRSELESAENAIRLLGCKTKTVSPITLPDRSVRTVISIEKITVTPSRYPRRGVKINKQPL